MEVMYGKIIDYGKHGVREKEGAHCFTFRKPTRQDRKEQRGGNDLPFKV